MEKYDFKKIEKKWQDKWYNSDAFKAIDFHPTKPKYYALYEFFNISGNLHMGHLKATVPTDALARYKRFCGYNVLFPIGGDAFGLPAENAARKTGIDPHDFVATTSERMFNQAKALGLSFDFSRVFNTSDEDYYKWTQWIFLQLFNHGKAYKTKDYVNYCPNCKTVLSNEDSQGGKCDRCGSQVVQEERWVWWLKMKEYSEKLLGNVDRIQMEESLKEAQRNWIGRSEGVELSFDLFDSNNEKLEKISIFTTCIETVYGITFLAIAPEHHLLEKYKDKIKNYAEVEKYKKDTAMRTEFDRMADQKTKTGCKVEGLYVINPLNGKKVDIYSADFVLASYGTGIVMAVPTHDQRDFDMAKKFNIPMIQVIEGDCKDKAVEKYEYIPKNSKMLNSAEFTGMPVKEAKQKITDKVIKMGVGKLQVNYKMTDWSFNRQRYWGEPFPVVFCDKCGTVALPEKDLPLTLPKVNDYTSNEKGDSPLSKATDWVNCRCPKCGGPAKRETDTMPNWAGSSWYWLRYVDPHNNHALADFDKLKYWGSVDCYTGGTEHITRHVLYAFFWQNFLYEIGAVPTRDPFVRKMGSGLVLDSEGKKMSKSSVNGVSPMEVIEKYGTDVTRMHIQFLGGYSDTNKWTYEGIDGVVNFLNRVWALPEILKDGDVSKEHSFELNTLIKKLGEDYENLSLNTAIAASMAFVKKIREDKFITKEELRQFLIVLNPIVPHITSEVFESVFKKDIMTESWPKYDEKALVKSTVEIAVQVNSKIIDRIEIETAWDNAKILETAKKNDKVANLISGKTIVKEIVVPQRLVNIIIK